MCGISKKICHTKSYETGTHVTIPTLQGGKLRQGEGAILSHISQERGRAGGRQGIKSWPLLQGCMLNH